MLGQWSDRLRRRISHRAAITLVITLSVLVGATSYAFVGYLHPSAAGPSACRRQPISATSVLSGSPAELAAEVANSLLGCASSVVVANDDPASVAAAMPLAEKAHAPLLLSSPLSATATSIVSFRGSPASRTQSASSASTLAALREINDLHPRNVLVVGLKTSELSAEMPGARVTSNPAGLADMSQPKPLSHTLVLVSKQNAAVAMAATATAEAAGARVVAMPGYDPRGDSAAITTIAKDKPRDVLAVGSGFGPASRLDSRLAVARTGVQLPDGGQLIVPMHRLVALYGHPGTPSLGALGEQGISASVTRIKKLAASYQALQQVARRPGVRDHHHARHVRRGADRGLLVRDSRGHAAPLGTRRDQGRDVRDPGPAAGPGQLPAAGQGVPAAAGAAERRPGSRPRVGAEIKPAAAAADRQRQHHAR